MQKISHKKVSEKSQRVPGLTDDPQLSFTSIGQFRHDPSLGKHKKHRPAPGKKPFFPKDNGFKKYWNRKPLPKDWKDLARSDVFHTAFSSFEQKFMMLFYKQKGFCNLSLNEIAFLFGTSNAFASKFMDNAASKGFVEKEERYQKNKDGSISKRRARNYYKLTKEGRKYLKYLLDKYFKIINRLVQNREQSSKECQGEATASTKNSFKKGNCSFRIDSSKSDPSNSENLDEFKIKLLLKEYDFGHRLKECSSKVLPAE